MKGGCHTAKRVTPPYLFGTSTFSGYGLVPDLPVAFFVPVLMVSQELSRPRPVWIIHGLGLFIGRLSWIIQKYPSRAGLSIPQAGLLRWQRGFGVETVTRQ
ncbi:hypothetical protein BaRGS_00032728 [Batillaria attramentaria]|uniref:Uncharacterized protein n=1 Tax=Batillaria attramentaria TaxID=370345 RepID=A0ABD0JMK6_9CAEN